MTDKRITELAARTSPTLEDFVEVVAEIGGSPTAYDNYKVTLAVLKAFLINGMITPGGRLTLETGVPVSTADQADKTSIFYAPYAHNVIALWNGTYWQPITFTEYTLALGTLTSGRPYDVFAYLNAGALAFEVLAWTSATARATEVTLQDGRYCKSGDKTRLYIGTFYTTATTTTEDSKRRRLLYNQYNRVPRENSLTYSTSHSYSTATTRQMNAVATNQIESMLGFPQDAAIHVGMTVNGNSGQVGCGVDSTTVSTCRVLNGSNLFVELGRSLARQFAMGYHFYSLNESATAGTAVDFCAFSGPCSISTVLMV